MAVEVILLAILLTLVLICLVVFGMFAYCRKRSSWSLSHMSADQFSSRHRSADDMDAICNNGAFDAAPEIVLSPMDGIDNLAVRLERRRQERFFEQNRPSGEENMERRGMDKMDRSVAEAIAVDQFLDRAVVFDDVNDDDLAQLAPGGTRLKIVSKRRDQV
uniref:Uncharacterized protein n=1 Tax=Plectus sambesii TaxID=2011161 RepID=A0A914UKI0_9BILA